jgi:hypothetical protein
MNEDYFPNKAVPIGEPTEITVGGNASGYKFFAADPYNGRMNQYASFSNGEFLYVFSSEINTVADVNTKNNDLVFDQMLKSIKFVNIPDDDNNSDDDNNGNGCIATLNDNDDNSDDDDN